MPLLAAKVSGGHLERMHGYYNGKDGFIRLHADATTNGHKLVNADSQTFTQMIKLNLQF